MKTVYLFRHSIPDRTVSPENGLMPLSREGKEALETLLCKYRFNRGIKIYTSPYMRAYESAEIIGRNITCDERLSERLIGNRASFTVQAWARQYADIDFANENGESFRSVRERMTAAVNEILDGTPDGGEVCIVSHAAAICAFLMQWCEIEVTDAQKKHRRITFRGETVSDGEIKTPSYFVLKFDGDPVSVRYFC